MACNPKFKLYFRRKVLFWPRDDNAIRKFFLSSPKKHFRMFFYREKAEKKNSLKKGCQKCEGTTRNQICEKYECTTRPRVHRFARNTNAPSVHIYQHEHFYKQIPFFSCEKKKTDKSIATIQNDYTMCAIATKINDHKKYLAHIT